MLFRQCHLIVMLLIPVVRSLVLSRCNEKFISSVDIIFKDCVGGFGLGVEGYMIFQDGSLGLGLWAGD